MANPGVSTESRIPLARPVVSAAAEAAVLAVLRSGQLVRGAATVALEDALRAQTGAAHALAVGSGTAALDLALRAVGVPAGADVLLPDFTFPSLANVILQMGARPVTVDISLDTFNTPAEAFIEALTPRTAAVVPVHQFGLPVDVRPLVAEGARRGFVVVEDAACALGATVAGRPAGTLGACGCFSFHPRKVLTTAEGGALVTHDEAVFRRAAVLANHGIDPTAPDGLVFVEAGWNWRLSNVHAALATGQMEGLAATIEARRRVAADYRTALSAVNGVIVPAGHGDPAHTFQSFVVLVAPGVDRTRVTHGLRARGVESTIGSYAIHVQPVYRRHFPDVFAAPRPASADAFARSLALPLYPQMTLADVQRVAAALHAAVEESWR